MQKKVQEQFKKCHIYIYIFAHIHGTCLTMRLEEDFDLTLHLYEENKLHVTGSTHII